MSTLVIDISFFLQTLLSLLHIIFLHSRQHAVIQYLFIFLRHFLFRLWIFFLNVLDGRLLFSGGMWWGIHIFDLLFTLRLCLYYRCKLYNYANVTLFIACPVHSEFMIGIINYLAMYFYTGDFKSFILVSRIPLYTPNISKL